MSALRPANAAPARVYITGSSVGNGSDTTEDTLQSFTLPAAKLASAGNSVRIFASGTFAASTDVKTIRLKFGGTLLASIVGSAAGATRWSLDCMVMKTGSSTQSFGAMAMVNGTLTPNAGTASVTDTSSIAITITGQNATNSVANSATCQLMYVEFIP